MEKTVTDALTRSENTARLRALFSLRNDHIARYAESELASTIDTEGFADTSELRMIDFSIKEINKMIEKHIKAMPAAQAEDLITKLEDR